MGSCLLVLGVGHGFEASAGGGFVDFVVHELSLLCFIHVCLSLFKGREPVCINIGQTSVVPFILGLLFRLDGGGNGGNDAAVIVKTGRNTIVGIHVFSFLPS